jgi:cytochrome c oxidase assembly protein subunit 15
MTPVVSVSKDTRRMAWWLVICAVMVFAMVVLGGATRLTGSGLSMVEWKPLTVTPPLNTEQWQAEFENYKQSPQFQHENSWMTVDDFKGIFWLEYLHRLWGRIIGAAFLLPFLWFLYKGAVDRPLAWRLGGLFVLGGAQGVLGWFMVASGLVDRPDVSQYRLAAHLLTALVLYGALVWTALDLFRREKPPAAPADPRFANWCLAIAGFVLAVMASGAFVAGLDAGMIYNTFPLMEGRVVPGELYPLGLHSAFEDIKTVQFNHRVLAIALVALITLTWIRARRIPLDKTTRQFIHIVVAMAYAQAALGIATLVTVVALPLALAHQGTALILFTFALCLAHHVRAPSHAQPVAARLKPAE